MWRRFGRPLNVIRMFLRNVPRVTRGRWDELLGSVFVAVAQFLRRTPFTDVGLRRPDDAMRRLVLSLNFDAK